jgi:phospholipid N-methyltransferase
MGGELMAHDNWTFFHAFLRSPQVVASVIPSSSFVERRVVRAAGAAEAGVVVELGGGTGGITRALLKAMGPQAHLLVFERTARFVDKLSAIHDPRLAVIHGCASTIGAELQYRGLTSADAVVSGIPFSTLPKPLAAEIIMAVHDVLAPGGVFVAYQFTDRVADYTRPVMGTPLVEFEICNVPPLRLFTWRKDPVPGAASERSLARIGA